VGGAALAPTDPAVPAGAVMGMDFSCAQLTGSDLRGRKSWFMLGDVVLALGSDIACSSEAEVETVIEQRKLMQPDGLDPVRLNGQPVLAALGDELPVEAGAEAGRVDGTMSPPVVQLDSAAAGAPIGYFLPTVPGLRQRLTLRRELREGSWREIHEAGDPARLRRPYLLLTLGHGVRPRAARYAYGLWPGASEAQLRASARQGRFEVLALDAAAHAVWDAATGLGGAAFWAEGPSTVRRRGQDWLSALQPCAVALHQQGDTLSLAVSDPTQQAGAPLQLQWAGPALKVLAQDDGVRVLRLSPRLELAFDVAGRQGQALRVRVQMPPQRQGSPAPPPQG